MRPLAPRERRIVALALLVAVVALAWLALVSPLLDGFHDRAQRRAELLVQYQADRRLLGSVSALERAAADQRRGGYLYQITAPSANVAADALKDRVGATLTAAGGAVGSTQQVQAGVPPGWVSARVDAQIGLPQLIAAIRELENEGPYVVVQYLSVEADRAASSGQAAPLEVRLQVSALFQPAQTAAAR
jgi:general secretion pathway protein M